MDEPSSRSSTSHLQLRKKLQAATGGQHYIETGVGRGYVLRDRPTSTWRPEPRERRSELGNCRFSSALFADD